MLWIRLTMINIVNQYKRAKRKMIMVFEYMSEYSGMLLGALGLLVVQAICDLSLPIICRIL